MRTYSSIELNIEGVFCEIDVAIEYNITPGDSGEWEGGLQLSPASPPELEITEIIQEATGRSITFLFTAEHLGDIADNIIDLVAEDQL